MKAIKAAAHNSHAQKTSKMTRAEHSDEKSDRSLVKKMVKPNALSGRASGGKSPKPKGKTQVNVLVAPQKSGPDASGAPVGGAPGQGVPLPSRPVQAAPAPQGNGLASLGNMPPRGAPGQMPPRGPIGAKRGGKIQKRADGGSLKWLKAGAGSGEGRLEVTKHSGVKPRTKVTPK